MDELSSKAFVHFVKLTVVGVVLIKRSFTSGMLLVLLFVYQ